MVQRLLLCITCLLIATSIAYGQQQEEDYSQEDFKSAWYVPDGAVLQFAGNMGMLSVGPHYVSPSKRLALELLAGFVPKFQGEQHHYLLTLKPIYQPFTIKLKSRHTITPVRAGIGFSYHFGDRYSLSWHELYPDGYYWWSTRIRILGYVGSSFNFQMKDRTKLVKELSLYSEVGTYDLMLTSLIKERGLSPVDIINLSIGLRVGL